MSLQTYLFYPLLAVFTLLAIYKIIQLKELVDYLKQESPDCNKTNPYFWELVGGTFVLLMCIQFPVQLITKAMFLKILPAAKFPFYSKLREEKAEMVAERMYKIFVYTISSVGILFVLKKGGYLHILLLGDQEDPQYYTTYPCTKMSSLLDDVYVLKLSYHLYELIYTLLYFRDRRDFPEYILHHVITLVLIIFSYSLNLLTLGSVIMFLTDSTDWFVCLFKLTVDIT